MAAQFQKSALPAAIATALILAVPLIGRQVSTGIAWTPADFLVAGALLFPAFLAGAMIFRTTGSARYRLALTAALGTVVLLLWTNLAVGLIGAGAHWGNWLYAGVLVVAGLGAWRSRLGAAGMATTQFAAIGALGLITVLALIFGLQHLPGSSIGEILAVNAWFAGMFLAAGMLFRFSVR